MSEREKVAAWMIERGYATGHGDTIEDLLQELEWQIAENWTNALVKGVEGEREACAKVCADIAAHREVGAYGMLVAHSCANEILARGQA